VSEFLVIQSEAFLNLIEQNAICFLKLNGSRVCNRGPIFFLHTGKGYTRETNPDGHHINYLDLRLSACVTFAIGIQRQFYSVSGFKNGNSS